MPFEKEPHTLFVGVGELDPIELPPGSAVAETTITGESPPDEVK